jgi:hypothetical protein
MKIETTELTVHLPEIPQTTTPEDDAPPPLSAANVDTPPSAPPVPDVPGEWWYSAGNGERKGPVSGHDLGVLLRDGGIKYGSDVWRQGFQEWQKAEDTDLLKYLRVISPPSVYEKRRHDSRREKGIEITSFVLGIIGCIAWYLPLFGFPINIAGLILGKYGRKKGLALPGMILSIIGLILTTINALYGAYLGATGQLF